LPRKNCDSGARTERLATRDPEQLCRSQALLSRPVGPTSKGLPKPMKGCAALLALANWRSALSEVTEGRIVTA
jgi:hypothetical protein